MPPKVLALLTTLCFLAGSMWLFFAVLHNTNGHFTYSLDDPYIHLALSERILHGLYGLNAGEPASSSSSLVWPFLFVPFVGTRIFPFMPLLLNIVFGAATAWLFGYIVATLDAFQPLPNSRWRAPLVAVLLLFATNLFGLAFTGMEHSLQVLLCVCCALGVLQLQWDRQISPVLLVAAALLPSVRYEGILPVFVLACALWAAQRQRKAIILMACSLAPLFLFSLFLVHLHLPFVPMSVLVKGANGAGAVAAAGATGSAATHEMPFIVRTLLIRVHQTERYVEFVLLLALAVLTYRFRKSRETAFALGAVTLIAAAQVAAGPHGWFFRYEMYMIGFGAPIAIAGLLNTPALLPTKKVQLHETAEQSSTPAACLRPQIPALLILAIAAAAGYYSIPFFATPLAAATIYGQQGQMARFADEFYKGPVAINDLGLVAMERDPQHYVLDLVGLGSYEVFNIRRKDHTAAWMESVAAEHRIELVMIYTEWFGQLPASWHPVGRLCVKARNYVAAQRNVVFYRTPWTHTDQLVQQIARFKQTLPPGDTLDLIGENSPLTCPA